MRPWRCLDDSRGRWWPFPNGSQFDCHIHRQAFCGRVLPSEASQMEGPGLVRFLAMVGPRSLQAHAWRLGSTRSCVWFRNMWGIGIACNGRRRIHISFREGFWCQLLADARGLMHQNPVCGRLQKELEGLPLISKLPLATTRGSRGGGGRHRREEQKEQEEVDDLVEITI